MKMRGIYTSVNDIRRRVFTEVARLSYEGGDYSRIEEVPFQIIPGEVASYRESVFFGKGYCRREASPIHRPAAS